MLMRVGALGTHVEKDDYALEMRQVDDDDVREEDY
jgi:hypothetical protein